MAAIKIRCSRPLCSSQTTTRTTPPQHPPRAPSQRGRNQDPGTRRPPTRNNPHTQHPRRTNSRALAATAGPVVPGPNSVPTPPRPSGPGTLPFPAPARHPGPRPGRPFQTRYYENPPADTTTGHDSLMFHPRATRRSTRGTDTGNQWTTPVPGPYGPGGDGHVLLRKEVIQPHLPVRLPCYDLVPIASPTFDGSPHKGWATGFGCYRLS